MFVSSRPPERQDRDDLLERYFGRDLRPLLLDVEARPDHYTEEARRAAEMLREGTPVEPVLRSELVLQFTRSTQAKRHEVETKRRVAEEVDLPELSPPPFEEQGMFQGAIKII